MDGAAQLQAKNVTYAREAASPMRPIFGSSRLRWCPGDARQPSSCAAGWGNFKAGHVEHADLYDATDADGTTYSVMVADVSPNVAVLAERAGRVPDNGGKVPEPGTLASMAAAAAGWWLARRSARARNGGG